MNSLAEFHPESHELVCKGNWEIKQLPQLQSLSHLIYEEKSKDFIVNGQAIHKMDTAGAWLLLDWKMFLEKKGAKVEFKNFSAEHNDLLTIVDKKVTKEAPPPTVAYPSFFSGLGQSTLECVRECWNYLIFIGMLTYESLRILVKPKQFRWAPLANVLYRTGFTALPIIALLSFMIGVVIAYQVGIQLRNYGANTYIVDLLGIAILREFGPLLTAIMVAGRTGSSYTAQLGMMNINQEIDALNTMGVTPAELLLIPRILGLTIALPLLTIWADFFGVLGGMIMANATLDITWHDFLVRFPHVVKLKNLLIGLGKAPVFALIIASIGCFEGMRVKRSAESVGLNTTRSVVLAIFFIIVADAAFSIILSQLKL